MSIMEEVRYKKCKHCGNRVHPRTRQCPYCGEVIGAGWFSIVGMVLLLVVVLGLLVYAFSNRTPTPGGVVVMPLKTSSQPD